MLKDYLKWTSVKSRINNSGAKPPQFYERQIWYCSIGENIGYEEDGKNASYERPVLIIKKYNNVLFFGVPLTSKLKPDAEYFFHLNFAGRENVLLLSQGRTLDALRLVRRMGQISQTDFYRIKFKLARYLNFTMNYRTTLSGGSDKLQLRQLIIFLF